MNELRGMRIAAGMTQQEVARNAGIAVANLSAYERGTRPLSPAMRSRIQRAMTRPSCVLAENRTTVLELLEQVGASNIRVFGSIARGDDTPNSDIDLIIDPPTGFTIYRLVDIKARLVELLGFSVDLVTVRSVPNRLRAILEEAVPL